MIPVLFACADAHRAIVVFFGDAGRRRSPPIVVVRPWKLPAHDDALRMVRFNPLALVAPLARELDRGLDRLRPRVHRQHAVASAAPPPAQRSSVRAVVVKGAARQRQPFQLLRRRPAELRVAVAEIEGREADSASK